MSPEPTERQAQRILEDKISRLHTDLEEAKEAARILWRYYLLVMPPELHERVSALMAKIGDE